MDDCVTQSESSTASEPVAESLRQWLALLDLAVNPHALRNYVIEQRVEEPAIESLLRFLVSKRPHSQADRDKVDWLVTHLFKMREERTRQPTGWPKTAVMEILQGFEFESLTRFAEDSLMEMPSLLDEMKYFERFSQITDSRIIERGRDLKNQFGEEFFHPDVLAAIVNYNLLFGKKFHGLFQDTMRKVHEFAQARPDESPPDAQELLESDYRMTTDAFRQLGDLGRKEAASADPVKTLPVEQQLRRLGIDPSQEALNLRKRIEELSQRLRTNPGITSIPNPFTALPLHEWETAAFRTQYAETEQTFRADFTRSIRHAIAITSRIYEEIPLYQEKRNSEYLWKKHYDSLVYLLYEGREHKDSLLRLSTISQQRGLQEKAKQLQKTAEKLDSSLSKVATLF